MKILVLSKQSFNKLMVDNNINDKNVENNKDIFFISINNTNENSHFAKNHNNVLIQHFDDVDRDLYDIEYNNGQLKECKSKIRAKAFTEEQAKELFEFLTEQQKYNRKKCFVHCSAGISRSGAVGTFVNDFFGGNYLEFRSMNPHIYENSHVLRLCHDYARKNQTDFKNDERY